MCKVWCNVYLLRVLFVDIRIYPQLGTIKDKFQVFLYLHINLCIQGKCFGKRALKRYCIYGNARLIDLNRNTSDSFG